MYSQILKSVVLTSFVVLTAVPSRAQVRADLGPVHIRIATDAPPRPQYEHRTAQPHSGAVWIKGYWDRQGNRWAWVPGRWEQPRDRHARWVNARYSREHNAWRYEPAHWSHQQMIEGDDYREWRSGHGYSNNHP